MTDELSRRIWSALLSIAVVLELTWFFFVLALVGVAAFALGAWLL